MKKLPIVALIGQTNAGKSSLLNRLAHKNIAIVAREEGTTRDNVVARIDDRFLLIDTAGLKDPTDDFEASIQDQIADAIEVADIILLTLDSSKYPDHRDKSIAKNALKSGKPLFLLLSKSDLGESLSDDEFLRLGIKPDHTFRLSATTGQGIKDLKNAILTTLKPASRTDDRDSNSFNQKPAKDAESDFQSVRSADANSVSKSSPGWTGSESRAPEGSLDSERSTGLRNSNSCSPLKLALIGRPNVGKSSLFNALGRKQQAIVSSRQGTTRDVNRVEIKFHGRTIEILDTAGLRKPGKREVGIEKFSALRTLAAIEEADICALLVDATEPHSKLDQSLAGQIIEAGKGIIVVLTKADLVKERPDTDIDETPNASVADSANIDKNPYTSVTDETKRLASACTANNIDSILDQLERDFNFLPYAPVLITSSETGQNITKLFELATEIDATRHLEIKTSELNKILNDAITDHIPAGLKNTRPKPKYIVQTDICPPWFVVHGRDLGLLHWSWKRFLERKIREKYPFVGTPIFFSFRNDNRDRKDSDLRNDNRDRKDSDFRNSSHDRKDNDTSEKSS